MLDPIYRTSMPVKGTVSIPCFDYKELKKQFMQNIFDEFSGEFTKGDAHRCMNDGIPKWEDDDPSEFIKWAFLQFDTNIPYIFTFVSKSGGLWMVSGGDCHIISTGINEGVTFTETPQEIDYQI